MNTFYHAVASLVDANTNYLPSQTRDAAFYPQARSQARRIRARSLLALVGKLRGALAERLAAVRAAAEERRQLRELRRLDDRLLRDIGLHRGDLRAVELGLIELEDLARKRRQEVHRIVAVAEPLADAARRGASREAANDPALRDTRCA